MSCICLKSYPLKSMALSDLVTISTGILSIIGGVAIGVKGLINLTRHFDSRFDSIERNFDGRLDRLGESMNSFVGSYQVERERNLSRIEKLEYRLSQEEARLDHKVSRLENGINQIARYLEKTGYQPRQIFPISGDE